jgi:ER lumen protein retaining receptor
MIQRMGSAETITAHYLVSLGLYRLFYVLNWLWRFIKERKIDLIAVIAGAVQTAMYADFFYLYFTRVFHGQNLVLPQ